MTALDGWVHDRFGTAWMLYTDAFAAIVCIVVALGILQLIKTGTSADFEPCITALIKDCAPLFFIDDERGIGRPNLSICEAMVAFADRGRAGLGHAACVGAHQYRDAARCFSHALRTHVGAGTKNSRTHTKSLRTKSRWAIRSSSAGGGRHQDVDQGRHRARARG